MIFPDRRWSRVWYKSQTLSKIKKQCFSAATYLRMDNHAQEWSHKCHLWRLMRISVHFSYRGTHWISPCCMWLSVKWYIVSMPVMVVIMGSSMIDLGFQNFHHKLLCFPNWWRNMITPVFIQVNCFAYENEWMYLWKKANFANKRRLLDWYSLLMD
jgi:hypothetical protein